MWPSGPAGWLWESRSCGEAPRRTATHCGGDVTTRRRERNWREATRRRPVKAGSAAASGPQQTTGGCCDWLRLAATAHKCHRRDQRHSPAASRARLLSLLDCEPPANVVEHGSEPSSHRLALLREEELVSGTSCLPCRVAAGDSGRFASII